MAEKFWWEKMWKNKHHPIQNGRFGFFWVFKWREFECVDILINGNLSHKFSVGKYYITLGNEATTEWKHIRCAPLPEYLCANRATGQYWRRVSGKPGRTSFPGSGISVAVTNPCLQAFGPQYSSPNVTPGASYAYQYLEHWKREAGSEGCQFLQRENRKGTGNEEYDYWKYTPRSWGPTRPSPRSQLYGW